MTEEVLLLERIKAKGGVQGQLAGLYIDYPLLSQQFIVECYEQCHNKFVIQFWGRELVNDITKYCIRHNVDSENANTNQVSA